MVTICTTSLTFNSSTFCPHSLYIFVWISEQTFSYATTHIQNTRTLCIYYITLRRVRTTIVAVENKKKYVLFTLSVCLQPWVSSMHSARAILSCVACLALLYFPHYLVNNMIFWGKKSYWTQNVNLFSLQLLSGTFPILSRTDPDITITVHISVCMYSAVMAVKL